MRGNIIESNVTERILSLPPVESKVMACHAMCGSNSTGNDTREGGAILEVAIDDDGNLSTDCRIMGGDLIKSNVTEGILPLPPFELRGFQHIYKSAKTTCSLRVLAAHKATRKHGVPCNDNARRRD
jgi:hypothetical protein